MRKLNVELNSSSYPIVITNSFDYLVQYVDGNRHRCIIITDSNAGKFHLQELCIICQKIFHEVMVYIAECGEQSKSLQVAEQIYNFLLENSVCRKDVIMTFGGGVIGDLGGFVAATFLRGIKLIQVPTSLLAQVDSSVGGKNAVNLKKTKNIIGTFYQPCAVYINYSVLQTLPIEEIRNGLVEILVHAIIKDEVLFAFIEDNLERILRLDLDIMEELIYCNCKIKSEVVQKDEKELGERAILNFGHTFGHAIESFYDYRYRHGECVAIGIMGACYIAESLRFITSDVTDRIKTLLKRMNVLHQIPDCDKEKVLEYLMHDKKFIDESVYFILPIKIGSVVKYEINDFKLVRDALEQIVIAKW